MDQQKKEEEALEKVIFHVDSCRLQIIVSTQGQLFCIFQENEEIERRINEKEEEQKKMREKIDELQRLQDGADKCGDCDGHKIQGKILS